MEDDERLRTYQIDPAEAKEKLRKLNAGYAILKETRDQWRKDVAAILGPTPIDPGWERQCIPAFTPPPETE